MSSKRFIAVVVKGHQVASGKAANSPYPKGSIEMQLPFFDERGLNLAQCYLGTLNLSIHPHQFSIVQPDFHFKNIEWAKGFAPEDFLFVECVVSYAGRSHQGYVYYPDPKTKIGHFQNASTIEVITEYIAGISYGDQVSISLDVNKVRIT